ncbi:redoxin domain-containing protein [Nibribacter ruber]|uniref:Redoxin domain-containing protein n=1 Tax=Nibribacter ruber TaxID=2698458 RepID=A0A6P1P2C8_9BACT|nr:TlpA family protein disulfide reductase [Nibribacter ruber]QHL88559.1 redoxin domain-containing protein [Nibribacter ruber]
MRVPGNLLVALCLLVGLASSRGAVAQNAHVPVIKLAQLQHYLNSSADTTYIINLWATWCKPCIEEIPHFEALQKQYANQPVKVLLVSLDFAKDLDKKVIPFVQRRQLKSTVLLLDEPDYNSWIDAFDPAWSGALPATLFFNNAKQQRLFVEKPLTPALLQEYLSTKFSLKP